jgi:hypothetical protein
MFTKLRPVSSVFLLPLCCLFSTHPLQAENVKSAKVPDVHIESTFGQDFSHISSFVLQKDGGRLAHGVQVVLGPNNQVRSLDVYDRGVVQQETRLHSNGKVFRFLKLDYANNGFGYETIYSSDGKEVFRGTYKAGVRRDGTFLVREYTSSERDDAAMNNAVVKEYTFKDGNIVSRKAFDEGILLLPNGSWLKDNLIEEVNDSVSYTEPEQ